MIANNTSLRFPLGRLVATPGALEALQEAGQSPTEFLDRHISGDWGEVDAEDCRANDEPWLMASGSCLPTEQRRMLGSG